MVANWKLNGNLIFNEEFASALHIGLKDRDLQDRSVVICPPSLYLQQLNGLILDQHVFLGAQDVSSELSGAFTGEISAAMLRELGCRFVIVGHSERRARFSESNELIVMKAKQAILAGVTPIICIGETAVQRKSEQTKIVLGEQLQALIAGLGEQLGKVILAYEPIWAIGTGHHASSDLAQEIHAWIRSEIEKSVPVVAQNIQLIYGGSVKGSHATELLQQPDIDGVLVGGASLITAEFLSICFAGLDS